MRFLTCPPEHFTVAYEINPFMHREVAVDPYVAAEQWQALRDALERCGAKVETVEPRPDLPDLVFAANAGLVIGDVAVPSAFLHPERRGEEPVWREWFERHGFQVRALGDDRPFEGAGDAMVCGPDGTLIAGYRWRSVVESHVALGAVLERPVRSVPLDDTRFYHLDLALLPVGEQRALAVGAAFDHYAATVVAAAIPVVEELTLDEGLAFCANSVVAGDVVVMHSCPPRVGRVLERWGYEPLEVPVGEFLKAGGSCRCLTLALGG